MRKNHWKTRIKSTSKTFPIRYCTKGHRSKRDVVLSCSMFLSHNSTTPKLIRVNFCDRRRSQKIVIFGWMLLLLVVLLVILATLLLGWACFGFCRRARNECNAENAADEFYSETKPKAALPPPTAHRLCLCHCHCRVSTSTDCSCCAFNESCFNRHSFVVRVMANPVQNFLRTHAALSICYCCARCDVSATRSS